jgi:glycosyltransferase involved in cell wall biosynthesis
MPTISVIIPTFNAESTIEATVQSVLNQSFSDLEILVINDGSTDSTVKILETIQDSRLRILHFDNAGVAISRNRGIQRAQGKFFAFLDSDDLWQATKLADQFAALTDHPESMVAYSWNDYIDAEGNFVHHGWHAQYQEDVYEAIFYRCFIENGSNILVRREAVEATGFFEPKTTPAEDWDFYLRLAQHYTFVCVPKVHVLYRISSESQSAQINRMERAGLLVLKRALERSPQRLSPLKAKALADFYSYLFHKASAHAVERQQWQTALSVFCRGIWHSPSTWNLIAKRRIGRAVYGFLMGQ